MAAVKKKVVKKVVKKAKKKVVKKVVAKKRLPRVPRAPKMPKMNLLDVLHQKLLLVEAQSNERYGNLTVRLVEHEERVKKFTDGALGQLNAAAVQWDDAHHNLRDQYMDLTRTIMDFLGKHEPVDTEFMSKRLDTLQDAVQQLASRLKELLPELS